MRLRSVVLYCLITVTAGGCASGSATRVALAPDQVIGVAVPAGSAEPVDAGDVMQLYNVTVGEDRMKNAASGAGTGAVVGGGVGAGAALASCGFSGPYAPLCGAFVLAAGAIGAIIGGTTGAVAGATVDTQEQVTTAPVHLYEVNQVLPGLQRDYLESPVLQARALQSLHSASTVSRFVPADWNGTRYAPVDTASSPVTDVNLVLALFSVSLNGKAKDDPRLSLHIGMTWNLTAYNPEEHIDEAREALSGHYVSREYPLSRWLADDGALLKTELATGLDAALDAAFAGLPNLPRRTTVADDG